MSAGARAPVVADELGRVLGFVGWSLGWVAVLDGGRRSRVVRGGPEQVQHATLAVRHLQRTEVDYVVGWSANATPSSGTNHEHIFISFFFFAFENCPHTSPWYGLSSIGSKPT